jgi:UDP-N-acetylmuramoyl-L-alanyl-D-glutamate--2,6-diaminopimelate ligase
MRLGDLSQVVPGSVLSGNPAVEVGSIHYDSRKVQPGSMFVAIRGLVADGNSFIDSARRKGAVAVVSELPAQGDHPWLQVPDARSALALLAAALFANPAAALELVGVTGTNGKTTTTYLIEAGLAAAGRKAGLIGTVQYRTGDRVVDATRTTPESSDLQALLREMVDAGCSYAVFEVSSISLALKRVAGCAFKAAVFTNLTRDHLDFHGDMDRYFQAKRLLFEEQLRPDGVAVLNSDDDRVRELGPSLRRRVLTFALGRPADITTEELDISLAGVRFRARTPAATFDVRSPLIGRFNVQNLLGAIGALVALDVPPEAIQAGLAACAGVPGRLERVSVGQDFTVVVDYAHTDDGLKKLLEAVRELKPGRIITVFGCGGDRDRTKRPLMGAVAARLSDVVVVTSDNPRSESPEAIIDEIRRGINGGKKPESTFIVDRREAIAHALSLAGSGDIVVIAGKGHETYQVVRDRTLPFDDREVAKELLRERLGAGGES